MVKNKHNIKLAVNGKRFSLEVDAEETLVFVLREKLGLTGTKVSCEQGECGACTVLLNGRAVNSCLIFAADVDECEITTITLYRQISSNSSNYHYPMDTEIQIMNNVKAGDYKGAEKLLEEIYNENYAKRKLPLHLVNCLSFDMAGTILKVLGSINVNYNEVFSENPDISSNKCSYRWHNFESSITYQSHHHQLRKQPTNTGQRSKTDP